MAFYNTKSGKAVEKKEGKGRVYVLKFELDCGTTIFKIGMCHSSRSNDRMMEVLKSFHDTYRYVPMCRLRRDREYNVPLLVEKHLHKLLSDLKHKFDKKFDGSTEFFSGLDEGILLGYIDTFTETDLLVEKDTMNVKDYATITNTEKTCTQDVNF